MPKYYDLEPYKNFTINKQYSSEYDRGWCSAIKRIMSDKPLEVQPVRHGRWLYKPEMYDESTWECSECGEPYTLIDGTPVDNFYFYCPNCGAIMDNA